MKKILLPLSLLLIVVLSGSVNKKSSTPKPVIASHSSEGEQEAMQRGEWERRRLADPATGRIPPGMRMRELAFGETLPKDANNNLRTASTVTWNFRGPWNVGGRTRAFAIDVTNENILFAGGVSGGLWRSTDGGATWNRVSSVNAYCGVNAIAQDKRAGHTNTWYYLSGEAYGTSASGGNAFLLGNGTYKSTDGGLTWTLLNATHSVTPQIFDNLWEVTWNVVTNNYDTVNSVVYAATYGTIYKSINGGTSWTIVRGGASAYSYFTDVAVNDSGVVYCTLSSDGSAKGVWRSPNGITFTNIIPSNFPVNYDRLKIGIDPNDQNVLYFFGPTPNYGKESVNFLGDHEWNSLWKYQYVSGNGSGAGGVWTDLSQNLPGYISQFGNLNTQGGYDLAVKVKPGDPNTLFVCGTNIFRSTTAFADSTHTTQIGGYAIGASLPFVDEYAGHHPDQHEIAFLPSNSNIMFSANDGGVSKTLDNTAPSVLWTELNDGYITNQFYTVAVDHATSNDIIIGGLQDNGTYYTNTTNSTTPWYHSIDGDGSYCQISDGGTNYYFSKQLGKMVKATVNGSGMITAYRRFDPIGADGYQFINPFVLDPNNNNMMYLAAGKYIWRNDDLSGIALTNQYDSISTNWVMFPDSVPTAGETVTAVAISKTPANRLYYGTDYRHLFRIDNASTGTPSPVDITSVLFPPTTVAPGYSPPYISCIAIDPNDADRVLVVFSNYNIYSLFYTTDGGTTWLKVAGNLEQTPGTGTGNGPSCRWASILPVSNGTVYLVGTSLGLFATDTLINNGTAWVQQGTSNIGSNVVDMMDVRISDGLVVAASHGNGVFSTHITSTGDITTIEELNETDNFDFTVYPNPVNDQLTIVLKDHKKNNNFKFSIVNELGIVVNRPKMKKNLSQQFVTDISKLSNGIYYLIVEDGKNKVVRSFVKI